MSLKEYKSFEQVDASLEIAFIGRSNVGKSTIMRELFGADVKIGRRPGVTQKPNFSVYKDLLITDMPGYGFMSGVDAAKRERVKDLIVKYFEDNAQRMLSVVQVIDVKSFSDIVDRWEGRGEVPVDIELNEFLHDIGADVVLAINKMDKIDEKDRDDVLNAVIERLGLQPPWTSHLEDIALISAKKGEIGHLRKILRDRLGWAGRDDLAGCLKK